MELKSLTEQKSLLATLPAGKRARLYRLLYEFGPGNGTLMLLPIDQGIEHGPRDFFPNPASKDPDYQFRLAAEAGYSALACQIGMAEKYYPDYAGKVPLILKVNGKTDLPSGDKAFSSCNSSVEDGVRLGVGLLDGLAVVLAETVEGVAALDRDVELRDVADLDRVVLAGHDRLGQVAADLLRVDVERGHERDVPDVVAAEVDVHQPGHPGCGIGVLVVLHSLHQRRGAVADADNGDSYLVGG